jgi:tRNA(fMet)-specific endonuclease VapC
MKAYLIETDVIIDLFNQREEAYELIEKLGRTERVMISAVTVAELRARWDEKKAANYLPNLYAIAKVMPLTKEIAELAGTLRFIYKRQGKPLPTIDTLIGATAIVNDFCLVTRNIKDYQIPELELYSEMYK